MGPVAHLLASRSWPRRREAEARAGRPWAQGSSRAAVQRGAHASPARRRGAHVPRQAGRNRRLSGTEQDGRLRHQKRPPKARRPCGTMPSCAWRGGSPGPGRRGWPCVGDGLVPVALGVAVALALRPARGRGRPAAAPRAGLQDGRVHPGQDGGGGVEAPCGSGLLGASARTACAASGGPVAAGGSRQLRRADQGTGRQGSAGRPLRRGLGGGDLGVERLRLCSGGLGGPSPPRRRPRSRRGSSRRATVGNTARAPRPLDRRQRAALKRAGCTRPDCRSRAAWCRWRRRNRSLLGHRPSSSRLGVRS
jgi:hypothetical protein